MFSFSKLAKMMPVRPLRWLGGWLTGSEWNVGYHLPGKCCAFTTGLSLDGVGNVGKTFPDVTSIIFTSWLVNSLANFLLCPKVLGYCGVVQNAFNHFNFYKSDSKWLYSMKIYFVDEIKFFFLWTFLTFWHLQQNKIFEHPMQVELLLLPAPLWLTNWAPWGCCTLVEPAE